MGGLYLEERKPHSVVWPDARKSLDDADFLDTQNEPPDNRKQRGCAVLKKLWRKRPFWYGLLALVALGVIGYCSNFLSLSSCAAATEHLWKTDPVFVTLVQPPKSAFPWVTSVDYFYQKTDLLSGGEILRESYLHGTKYFLSFFGHVIAIGERTVPDVITTNAPEPIYRVNYQFVELKKERERLLENIRE